MRHKINRIGPQMVSSTRVIQVASLTPSMRRSLASTKRNTGIKQREHANRYENSEIGKSNIIFPPGFQVHNSYSIHSMTSRRIVEADTTKNFHLLCILTIHLSHQWRGGARRRVGCVGNAGTRGGVAAVGRLCGLPVRLATRGYTGVGSYHKCLWC